MQDSLPGSGDPQQAAYRMDEKAECQPARGRQENGGQCPPDAVRLLPDGQAGGRAGPVRDGEYQRAQRGAGRPAVRQQQGVERGKVGHVRQCAGGQIAHHHQRHHQLVRREAEEKGEQDNTVQTEQPGEWVEQRGQVREDRRLPDGDIGEQPDQHARGRGHCCRAAQYEQRAVEQAAHDHLADLRRAVGRQLEHKRGRHAFEHGRGQQARGRQRQSHAAGDHRGQQQCAARSAVREKGRAQEDQQRETPVARRERIGEHGDQPLAGRVDDAAAGDAAGVASKPHAHAWVKSECDSFVVIFDMFIKILLLL